MLRRGGTLALALLLTACAFSSGTEKTPDVRETTASSTLTLPMRPRDALDGRVTFLAPDPLGPMPLPLLIRRYPAPQQPDVVLSDASGNVVFSLEHTKAHTMSDMQTVRTSMSGVFHHSYADAVWYRDELANINGRAFAVFELEHGPVSAREHLITCVTIFEGTMLLASFSASGPALPAWLSTGRSLMESLVLHDAR